MTEQVFWVHGMHCAACAASVEKVTRKLPGVESADVNLMTEKLYIRYDEAACTPDRIVQKIEKAGFSAGIFVEDKTAEDKSGPRLWELLCMAAFALAVTVLSLGNMFGILPAWLRPQEHYAIFAWTQFALCLPVLVLGRRFYVGGFSALFRGHPDMNTLVALSSSVSFLYSVAVTVWRPADEFMDVFLLYESAVMVPAMVSVGKYLEKRTKKKTGKAIEDLLRLSPEEAQRWDGATECAETVPVASLYLGDTVLVRTGDRVPVDGKVLRGSGTCDESMLTGESVPVEKTAGDSVSAGTLLTDGTLFAEVRAIGHDTVLYGIVRFVEDAQRKKAPVARLADRVSGVFVPIVCIIALLAGLLWWLIGHNLPWAVRIFASVLVVACPCAMGLATPTAIMAGTGLGARHGILVRSGEALETLSRVDTVVFDKTGTVTEGKLTVSRVLCAPGTDETAVLAAAGAVERFSSHPLAKAVCEECEARNIVLPNAESAETAAGQGVSGTVDGKTVRVGNGAFCGVTDATATDETAVYVTRDGVLLGTILLRDTLRPEAAETVRALKKRKVSGYRRNGKKTHGPAFSRRGMTCVLLTGDREGAAKHVGDALSFDKVYSGILPTQKAEVIASLQAEGRTVLMVGDGINDAPALTAADVGLAVGNGTDIAIDAADAVLTGTDLRTVVKTVVLGEKTLRTVRGNLFWAFIYNIIAIPVACGVLYAPFGFLFTPMLGSICMSLSSLFVVTNALRLGRAGLEP